eukprot:1160029-Pelagomonas_calceolata.AAC.4
MHLLQGCERRMREHTESKPNSATSFVCASLIHEEKVGRCLQALALKGSNGEKLSNEKHG